MTKIKKKISNVKFNQKIQMKIKHIYHFNQYLKKII